MEHIESAPDLRDRRDGAPRMFSMRSQHCGYDLWQVSVLNPNRVSAGLLAMIKLKYQKFCKCELGGSREIEVLEWEIVDDEEVVGSCVASLCAPTTASAAGELTTSGPELHCTSAQYIGSNTEKISVENSAQIEKYKQSESAIKLSERQKKNRKLLLKRMGDEGAKLDQVRAANGGCGAGSASAGAVYAADECDLSERESVNVSFEGGGLGSVGGGQADGDLHSDEGGSSFSEGSIEACCSVDDGGMAPAVSGQPSNNDVAQTIIAGIGQQMQSGFGQLTLSFQELSEVVEALRHRVQYLEDALLCNECQNVRGDLHVCGCEDIKFVGSGDNAAEDTANEKKKAKKLRQRQRRMEKVSGSGDKNGGGEKQAFFPTPRGAASGEQQASLEEQGSIEITKLDAWKSVVDGRATDMGEGCGSFKSGSVGSEDFEDI